MSYDNINKGSLFKNDRKETANRPDYKGSINVEGTEYWISGWIKTAGPHAKNPGSKFLSVSLMAKNGGSAPKQPQSSSLDCDDDIPF